MTNTNTQLSFLCDNVCEHITWLKQYDKPLVQELYHLSICLVSDLDE